MTLLPPLLSEEMVPRDKGGEGSQGIAEVNRR
jgi:hypothetical protein